MKQDNTVNRINDYFNRLIISIYRYFRTKPSTSIDYVKWWGAGEDLGINKRLSAWKKVIKTDKIIDAFTKNTGIKEYRTTSLYNLSESDISSCFIVHKLGFLKPDDFAFANPISNVFVIDDLKDWTARRPVKYFMKQLGNPDILNAARQAAENTEEFRDIKMKLASYVASIDASKHSTKRIQGTIEAHGISCYMGKSLFDIDNEELLNEAVYSIATMSDLLSVGVCAYKGEHITNLSKFMLDKAEDEHEANDFTNLEFDDVVRVKYLKELQDRRDEELAEEKKRIKRNEAARKRRANSKNQLQATSLKPAAKAAKTTGETITSPF